MEINFSEGNKVYVKLKNSIFESYTISLSKNFDLFKMQYDFINEGKFVTIIVGALFGIIGVFLFIRELRVFLNI